jgi:hypothetical protein
MVDCQHDIVPLGGLQNDPENCPGNPENPRKSRRCPARGGRARISRITRIFRTGFKRLVCSMSGRVAVNGPPPWGPPGSLRSATDPVPLAAAGRTRAARVAFSPITPIRSGTAPEISSGVPPGSRNRPVVARRQPPLHRRREKNELGPASADSQTGTSYSYSSTVTLEHRRVPHDAIAVATQVRPCRCHDPHRGDRHRHCSGPNPPARYHVVHTGDGFPDVPQTSDTYPNCNAGRTPCRGAPARGLDSSPAPLASPPAPAATQASLPTAGGSRVRRRDASYSVRRTMDGAHTQHSILGYLQRRQYHRAPGRWRVSRS